MREALWRWWRTAIRSASTFPRASLSCWCPPEVLDRRREAWQRPEKDIPDGYLSTYRKNSLSAAQGAVVQ